MLVLVRPAIKPIVIDGKLLLAKFTCTAYYVLHV